MAKLNTQLSLAIQQKLDGLKKEYLLQTERLEKAENEGHGDTTDFIEEIQKQSELVLQMMEIYFENKVTQKTLSKYLTYTYFYLDYAAYHEGVYLPEALDSFYLSGYFGDWYISHNLSSTVQSTKDSIVALTRMAQMFEALGLMDKKAVEAIKRNFKEDKEEWLERMALFNDPDRDYEEYSERLNGLWQDDIY